MAANVFAGRSGFIGFSAASSNSSAAIKLGKWQNWEITVTGETIDVTNNDSGVWREKLFGHATWSGTAEAVQCSTALSTSITQDDFRSDLSSGTRKYWVMYDSTGTGGTKFHGWAYPTGFGLSADHDGAVMTNFGLDGDGALNF
jgi:predicted secreted protein